MTSGTGSRLRGIGVAVVLLLSGVAVFAPAAQADTTVMRVTDITLTASKTNPANMTARVTVKTDLGSPVEWATVSAKFVNRRGETSLFTAPTSTTGLASFTMIVRNGTYTFTVTDVSKPGYTFDSAGTVLTKTIKT
jgi:hypothetical protein